MDLIVLLKKACFKYSLNYVLREFFQLSTVGNNKIFSNKVLRFDN